MRLSEVFRANLVKLRQDRGITQEELAAIVGKPRTVIADIERGRNSPNLTTITQIARAFDVDPASLLKSKK